MVEQIIIEKQNNIGSMILYIKNRPELLKEIDDIFYSKIDIKDIDLTLPQKIYYIINNVWSLNVCTCGKLCVWIGFKNGFRISCGKKECYIPMVEKNNIEKYGVSNTAKLKEMQDKKKKKFLEKHGVDHQMKLESTREKFTNTMVKRYGAKYSSQSEELRIKIKESFDSKSVEEIEDENRRRSETMIGKSDEEKASMLAKRTKTLLERYGEEYTFNVPFIKDKIEKTIKERYNGIDPRSTPEVIKRRVESYSLNYINKIKDKFENVTYINHNYLDDKHNDILLHFYCKLCDNNFNILIGLMRRRYLAGVHICTKCLNKTSTSVGEKELLEYIKSIYDSEIVINSTNIVKPRHIDIYLPKANLAFEFNGTYWHNELFKPDNYHLTKSDICLDKNIKLIHIWEDDWINKKEIVKSKIYGLLSKGEIIDSNKCDAKIIDNELAISFLNDNHLNCNKKFTYNIGLYYKEELVSVMTFLYNKKNDFYELNSLCNKKFININGGSVKMFDFFISNVNPEKIISCFDRSWGYTKLYMKLGFVFETFTEPEYYYVINNERRNKNEYAKHKLSKMGYDPNKTEHEIMLELKKYRIYDSGNETWIWNKPVNN